MKIDWTKFFGYKLDDDQLAASKLIAIMAILTVIASGVPSGKKSHITPEEMAKQRRHQDSLVIRES